MATKKDTVVYENTHYTIHKLTQPFVVDGMEVQPLCYSLTNKETEALETYSSFFPAAIETADHLAEKMRGLRPSLIETVNLADVSSIS